MIFTDLFENTDQPSRVKFQGTDHDIGEERYVFSINGNPEVFNFPSDEDDPDPDSPSFEEILARVQRDGAMEHYRVTPAEQQAIAKKIAAERQRYLDQRRQGVSENAVKGNAFKKTMVKPQEAYQLLAGGDPKAFAIDVLMPDQSAVKRLQAAIGNQAKIRGDDSIVGDGIGIQIVAPVFPDGRAAQQAFEMMMDLIRTHGGEFNRSTGVIIATPASQDMAEGHADQQRKIIKKAGRPVGEIGIDRESSPGVGQYYMKHYASGTDLSGYDSFEEAMDELRYAVKQGVSEAIKPSDIPPSTRQRLSMRDIEAERPQGAFRFRVVTPQGDEIDFMDRSAADSRAKATGGRVEPINPQPQGLPGRNRFRVQDPEGTRPAATFQDRAAAERYASAKKLPVEIIPETESRKGASARIERILKMLRARHPQAENDLEALIFDFRGQQAQDRTDIARLDAENDMEEADIARLEKMLDLIRRRRGAAAAEPVQEDDIDDAMKDYLVRGGEIKQEPARMPRLGTRLRQHGSRHIGQGREGRAGQLSGRGANTNLGSNKPVVTAESLRDGEYHIATVTLDDGSKKKVRITSDEGFRDQIQQHFAKQGREVQDIDVDYAVRSDLGEAKKKPQPTNPELWSRAKAAARSKFDVYPSAYANAWAAKWYKSKGGGWRMGKPKKK